MPLSSSLRDWLRLPGRLGLVLGFGALSAMGAKISGAQAHRDLDAMRSPPHGAISATELWIWSEGGRIYLAEPGRPARELQVPDTAEARRLREVLQHRGAAAKSPSLLQDRIILAGGGGDGFHWKPANRDRSSHNPANPIGAGPSRPGNGRDSIRRGPVPQRDKTAITPRSDKG